MVQAHFESTASLKTVGDLQNIAIRLFATYGVSYNGACALSGDKDPSGNHDDSEDDTWVTKGQKEKKPRRVFELNAARRSPSTIAAPNPEKVGIGRIAVRKKRKYQSAHPPLRSPDGGAARRGKGAKCIRGGIVGNFWLRAPRPFKNERLFGPEPSSDKSGNGSAVLNSDDISNHPDELINLPEDQPSTTTAPNRIDNDAPGACFEEESPRPLFCLIAQCALSNPTVAASSIAIDSGASSTVYRNRVVRGLRPSLLSDLPPWRKGIKIRG